MLIDTSGFLCLLHKDEPEHPAAVLEFENARYRLTHSYILAEFIPLARSRKFPAEKALAFSGQIIVDPELEVVWVDRDLHLNALEILKARGDKGYSLCDAVSFVLMRQYGITDALTTDKHFEQEGFVRKLR